AECRPPPPSESDIRSATPVVVVVVVPTGTLLGEDFVPLRAGCSARPLSLEALEVGGRRAVLDMPGNLGLLCLSPAAALGQPPRPLTRRPGEKWRPRCVEYFPDAHFSVETSVAPPHTRLGRCPLRLITTRPA